MLRYFRSNRFLMFCLIHGVLSIGLCVYVISKLPPLQEPPFAPYIIAFAKAFLGSFAASLMSIILLVLGAFKGFAGAPQTILFSHAVAWIVVAGAVAICAFLFLLAGLNMFGRNTAYVVLFLSSCLFLFSAYAYFLGGAYDVRDIFGHPAFIWPGR